MTWPLRFIAGRWQRRYDPGPAALPAFVFDQQRKTCEACARYREAVSVGGVVEACCELRGRKRVSCSSARLPDGICGPAASRFKAKGGVA